MAEYIERKKLEEALTDVYRKHYAGTALSEPYTVAWQIMRHHPVVDIEPVKHGKWEFKGYDVYCSSCGMRNKNAVVCVGSEGKFVRESFKYCPDCGARMDGDSND